MSLRLFGVAFLLAGCGVASVDASSSTADLASACDDGMRVVNGVCARVPQATFILEIVAKHTPGMPTDQETGFYGVSIRAPNGNPEPPTFATIGTCKIHKNPAGQPPPPASTTEVAGDWGTVTKTGWGGSVDLYHQTDGHLPAYLGDIPPNFPVFRGGETQSLATTGSHQFPAWRSSLQMPLPLVLNPSPRFVPGRGFDVSWKNVDPGSTIIIILATADASGSAGATCEVPDSGSWTVPSAVTALLHPSTPEKLAQMLVSRKRSITNEPADVNVILEWDAFARDGFSLRP